jgi:PIN domain nuclease of toxin-antitoxin system
VIAAVTDTHPFLRYLTGQHNRLGKRALRLFEAADRGDGSGIVYVPTVVLCECLMLSERIHLGTRFDHFVGDLVRRQFFLISPLTEEVLLRAFQIPQVPDIFDRLVAAAALDLDLPLVTEDEKIVEANCVEILWDE